MIENIIQWIAQHKEIVSMLALAILQIILFIIKKKPVKILDYARTIILNSLPILIEKAESTIGPGHGEDKMSFCLYNLEQYLKEEYPEINFKQYQDFAIKGIEEILKTPQRKEKE